MSHIDENRKRISRENGAKSHGPKTPEGKAKSSRNSLKHGMTATKLVLENENPIEIALREHDFFTHYQPVGPLENFLLGRVVQATVQIERCERAQCAILDEQVRHAEIDLDIYYNEHNEQCFRDIRDKPVETVHELRSTSNGCQKLLINVTGLYKALETHGVWTKNQLQLAEVLIGPLPDDSNLLLNTARPADLENPPDGRTRDTVRASILDGMDACLATLRAWEDQAHRNEEARRAGSRDAAMVIRDLPLAQSILRYQTAAISLLFRAEKRLMTLIKERGGKVGAVEELPEQNEPSKETGESASSANIESCDDQFSAWEEAEAAAEAKRGERTEFRINQRETELAKSAEMSMPKPRE